MLFDTLYHTIYRLPIFFTFQLVINTFKRIIILCYIGSQIKDFTCYL